jgi:hypothetical protein
MARWRREIVFMLACFSVDRDVRDAEAMIGGGVTRVHREALRLRVVGRASDLVALVGLVGIGGGDQRYARLA